MVPVRAVTEAFGFDVTFDDESGAVRLTQNGLVVELFLGQAIIKRRDEDGITAERTIDVSPYMKEERTYVPLRFSSEELGLDVQWIAEHRAIIIRSNY